MVNLGDVAIGAVVGFALAAIVFTATGREVTAKVVRATGARLAYHIEPRK